jgi:hypothetical protein
MGKAGFHSGGDSTILPTVGQWVSGPGVHSQLEEFMAEVRNEYDVKTDAKRRITLRSARYSYYHAREFEDGRILLEPRELKAPATISALTLSHMDEAMRNIAVGSVGEEFDLADVQGLIDEE